MSTFEKVQEIIVETFNCDLEEVTLQANLSEDLGADSLDAVELSMAIEEEFSITIDDNNMAEFKTVKDIVSFIDSQK